VLSLEHHRGTLGKKVESTWSATEKGVNTSSQKNLFEIASTSESFQKRRGHSDLFAKAILKEAIAALPKLPLVGSVEELRKPLRSILHFNSEQTRIRYSNYILRRMFPSGQVDRALLAFAKNFVNTRELKEVCFYKFMKSQPIMERIALELLIPRIGIGSLQRKQIHDYLAERYPGKKSYGDYSKEIVEALEAGGLVNSDSKSISFRYRDLSIVSFAFVLHSEFPVPGMFDIAGVESNDAMQAMLWDPSRFLPGLYELRNRGLISKVSEIDNVRQFTTKLTLTEAVERLVFGEKP
jgi:DNA repair protein RadC